jgi:hypothetical protein
MLRPLLLGVSVALSAFGCAAGPDTRSDFEAPQRLDLSVRVGP